MLVHAIIKKIMYILVLTSFLFCIQIQKMQMLSRFEHPQCLSVGTVGTIPHIIHSLGRDAEAILMLYGRCMEYLRAFSYDRSVYHYLKKFL